MTPGDFVAEDGPDHPVHVRYRQFGTDRLSPLDCRTAEVEQSGHVDGFFQAVVLLVGAVTPNLQAHFRLVEYIGKVETFCLPVLNRLFGLQDV